MRDGFEPERYDLFKAERSAPFHDLVALLEPVPAPRVVDLGCGTGELTATLVETLDAAHVLGIDSAAAMLAAAPPTSPRLSFERGDIAGFDRAGDFDIVLANASLQWLPDHAGGVARLATAVRPGAQLAFQVPANAAHPSHAVSRALAEEPRFRAALGGAPPPDPAASVLAPEAYAELLDSVDYAAQHVRLQVYGHRLASTAAVVDWVSGTSLTRFRERLDDADYAAFVACYRERLLAVLGERAPYFYAFRRILVWGRR